ncbi:MAG: hypothetical protein Q9178_000341 [Gyalolechia marmorata]
MEATGLSIGIAALFTSCVQCFEYFKAATTLREDFEILLLKLEIEQERFLVWGEDAGIGTDDWEEQSLFNGDSKRQDLVRRCLDAIRRLLENAEDLKSQYGGQPTILQKTRWVIHDAAKFGKLIKHLRDLINSLREDGHGPLDTLEEKMKIDIAYMIDDIGKLRLLPEACGDVYPQWSETARSAIDASELGTEGEYIENYPLAQIQGSDTVNIENIDARPIYFGDEKVYASTKLQIFFMLTEECRNLETELPCEQTDLGRMSFDATQSFIPAVTQIIGSSPGQCVGKLINPGNFTRMNFDRYEDYIRMAYTQQMHEDKPPSLPEFCVHVYIYCAPCACQVASAIDIASSIEEFPYMDVQIRVDCRLQSSCVISSSVINGLQSLINYIKEEEKTMDASGYFPKERTACLKAIDRQWLEQAVYRHEEDPDTTPPSPADRMMQIVRNHCQEVTCAALMILGEADYCIPLIGAPPFPPLSQGRLPRETELYQMSQQFSEEATEEGHWRRGYMGTYTARAPPIRKRRIPVIPDTDHDSQGSLPPPANRSAISEPSHTASQG